MSKYIRVLTIDEVLSRGGDLSRKIVDSSRIFDGESRFQGRIGKFNNDNQVHDEQPIFRIDNKSMVLSPHLYDVLDISSLPKGHRLFSLSFSKTILTLGDTPIIQALLSFFMTDSVDLEMKEINLNDKGLMTYETKGHSKRKSIKIGRGIIKLLKLFKLNQQYSPSDIEILTNTLKAYSLGSDGFGTVKGKDILAYYHESSYDWDMNIGSLGKSCMRNSECQKFLQFYVDNKDICELLFYSNPTGAKGKITARALLWKIDSGETFMDRVYGDDKTQVLFEQYAKDKGYLYKKTQSFTDKDLVIMNGSVETKEMKITLKKPLSSYKLYPYLDTFTYDAGQTTMVNVDSYVEIGKFDEIRGGFKTFDICYISKKKTFDKLYVYIDIENEERKALSELVVLCEEKDYHIDRALAKPLLSGSWAYEKDIIFIDSQNGYEYNKNTFKCVYDDKLYSLHMYNGRDSIAAYRETAIGKVHLMNYNFLTEEQKSVKKKVEEAEVLIRTFRSSIDAFNAYDLPSLPSDGILSHLDREGRILYRTSP